VFYAGFRDDEPVMCQDVQGICFLPCCQQRLSPFAQVVGNPLRAPRIEV
jgi:hypothetical protein